MTDARRIALIAALLGGVTVALGAFGAHGLKDALTAHPAGRELWDTATHYALIHAAALLGLAGYAASIPAPRGALFSARCWFFGSVVFAGTLMLIALGGPKSLGAITPLGGLAMIVGWIILGVSAARDRR